MGPQKKTVAIDGFTYELTMLGAREGRRVLARLVQMAAPMLDEFAKMPTLGKDTLTALADASKTSDAAAEKAEGLLRVLAGAASKTLIEGLSPDAVDYLCDAFSSKTVVMLEQGSMSLAGNNGANFDIHFAGGGAAYMRMTRWLIECARFNFADFLGGAPDTGRNAPAVTPSP